MNVAQKIPPFGESIKEVTLIKWLKKNQEWVEEGDEIAELESEKVNQVLEASNSGILNCLVQEGDTLKIGESIADITLSNSPPNPSKISQTNSNVNSGSPSSKENIPEPTKSPLITPLAKNIISEEHINIEQVKPSGERGKIIKQDVIEAQKQNLSLSSTQNNTVVSVARTENIEKISNLRKTISRRLVDVKNKTAMLTTFNEVDMSAIMEIRSQYKNIFKERHEINLGFMSFFLKAASWALIEYPKVNSYFADDQILSHNYVDISIAVSTDKGLTVPVIRDVHVLSLAELEKQVALLALKARDNKLTMNDLTGGTFTITNGGVFGSLMSTPIINPPQSAILGMHKIQDRPIALNGQVVIKPMMYLALSYDHRIIDGKESVGFLVKIKELLENPQSMLNGRNPILNLLQI
ncbi:MAG: 2-oxoglutarate dehydrogenase complex dihydrolipoyllysine-residue succinyltransferase [Sediminibacterium sp.]|nr:2-oxoglutarate dehydrogenase complex dihydrolipoyllysine-residue succinyltransferase [Sediminibacterium sp.]